MDAGDSGATHLNVGRLSLQIDPVRMVGPCSAYLRHPRVQNRTSTSMLGNRTAPNRRLSSHRYLEGRAERSRDGHSCRTVHSSGSALEPNGIPPNRES